MGETTEAGRRRGAQTGRCDRCEAETAASVRGWQVVPEGRAVTEIAGERASNAGVVLFSAVVFAASFALALVLVRLVAGGVGPAGVAIALVAAALVALSVHIAQQWERVVVLRLGAFNRVSGPGLFWTIPVIEQNVMRVDTRVRTTAFGAEETLTADLVPLDVNAVLFWHVWDAKAACVEVGDFTRAVELAAQTALRDAIGRASAAEVAIRRNQLDRELKRVLEEKVAPWGVTVLSVEVRDILLPKELQDVAGGPGRAAQEGAHHLDGGRAGHLRDARRDGRDVRGQRRGAAPARHAPAVRERAGDGRHRGGAVELQRGFRRRAGRRGERRAFGRQGRSVSRGADTLDTASGAPRACGRA